MDMRQRECIERLVREKLKAPAKQSGSFYLEDAIAIAMEDRTVPMMELYARIAKQRECSAACVERLMRYLIDGLYRNGRLRAYFPYAQRRPSNSEVIWTLAEQLRYLGNESGEAE